MSGFDKAKLLNEYVIRFGEEAKIIELKMYI